MKVVPNEDLFISDTNEQQTQILKAIVENERLFRAIADMIPNIIWTTDGKGKPTFFNKQWYDYTGLTTEQENEEWADRVLHPDDRDRCLKQWNQAITTGDAYEIEVRHRRHDGVYRWFVTRAVPLKDNHGNVQSWYGSTTDIDEQKVAEERLKESEAHYRQLLKGLPVAVYTCDKDGYVQLYNKAAIELWGREPVPGKDHWCGSWRLSNIDGSDVELDECPMAEALKEGRAVFGRELIVERPDGSKRIVMPYPQPLFNVDGEVTGGVNVVIDITEQKHSQQALKESETQYRQLLQGLPAAVYTCDADGYVLLYNKAAVELWGREPVPGEDLWCGSWKIFKPDGSPLPLDQCPMAVALKEGRSVLGEEIIIERPNGDRRHIAPHPEPFYDTNGKLIGALNMLIDITHQKETSEALRESEELFRTLATHAPITIWMADDNGNCTYLNSRWSEITGKNVEEGFKDGWLNFVHPEDLNRVIREWKQALTAQSIFDTKFRHINSNNEYILIKTFASPRYNSTGKFVGYVGILEDITLQENVKASLEKEIKKQTENLLTKNEELRRSEERYHRMTAEVQDYAIILLSKDGIIENWNKGAETIKGYTADEVVGKSFSIFYPEQDRESGLPYKVLEQAREHGRAIHEGLRVKKDGSFFWGSVVITALHDDNDHIVGFTKVTRDLTERKNAESELKATALQLQEKNRELERMNQELASFAYISSHDLQEPLRKIQTFVSRIQDLEEINLPEKGKDYFARIQSAAFRMQTLINDLLTYSRTNTAERVFELTDTQLLLEDVLNELKDAIEEKRIVVESDKLPKLNLIRFQFHQLLTNIINNAIKFSRTDIQPRIVIRTDTVKGSNIPEAPTGSNRKYCHISITDNGIGFDPAYSHKIFEVFQRLHTRSEYKGTGIGLAICKKIMDNHEGIIRAEGEINKGATFHLYIPLV